MCRLQHIDKQFMSPWKALHWKWSDMLYQKVSKLGVMLLNNEPVTEEFYKRILCSFCSYIIDISRNQSLFNRTVHYTTFPIPADGM